MLESKRRVWTAALVGLLAAALASCGSERAPRVIARIGSESITDRTLARWSRSAEIGAVSVKRGSTLEFLISSLWLIDEAARQHVNPSVPEVDTRVEALRARPGGVKRRTHDLDFQARAELASVRLRRLVLARAGVSSHSVVAYYRRHHRRFVIPEHRDFLIANLHSDMAARRLRADIEGGKPFAPMALHESLVRGVTARQGEGRAANERAIFGAPLHVLSGPIILEPYKDHSIFEVTRIVRASYVPLRKARGAIRSRLERRALSSFIAEWRHSWQAVTHCPVGYVVRKCAEFRRARSPEDPLSFD